LPYRWREGPWAKITTTGFELPSDLSSPVTTLQVLVERLDRAEQKLIVDSSQTTRDMERIWKALDEVQPSRRCSGGGG
jgi:hypothetical protein